MPSGGYRDSVFGDPMPLECRAGLVLECRPSEVMRLMWDIDTDERREILMAAVRLIESYPDDDEPGEWDEAA